MIVFNLGDYVYYVKDNGELLARVDLHELGRTTQTLVEVAE